MTGAARTGAIAPIRKPAPTRPTIIFLKVFILCFSISMMLSLLAVYECSLNIGGKYVDVVFISQSMEISSKI
ncbi:hypothetical protein KCX83_05690 [Brucella oryzae]|uniref:hypothetical protein n=1 Tax=Brucella oryzae TaxID=335286 RepID=UPI001B820D25|nr:hypothetical protein [Brucella oryzae]MBR7651813.1 hypothetical protein [Brucella oryzae]